jgi:SNF2 family DNA or RNA helicase
MLARQLAEKLYAGKLPQGVPMDALPYQDEAVAKLLGHPKHILGYPMGTGKTMIAMRLINEWKPKRSLIIPTERAILAWLKVMWQWFPEMLDGYIVLGKGYNQQQRRDFWTQNAKHPRLSVICNYNLLIRDRDFIPTNFDMVMADEYHKFARNPDTKFHSFMQKVVADKVVLISGSPSSKGAIDYFVPLNILDKKLFKSYWKFAYTWCNVEESEYGKRPYGSRNEVRFRELLNDYAIVKTKKELGIQKKIRDIMRVSMTPDQESAYDRIKEDFILELEGYQPVVALNTMVQYIKLRQILSCPAIIHPNLGIGGGAKAIFETLYDLPVEERHAVIFTPFRGALGYLYHYFSGTGHTVGLDRCPGEGDIGVPVYTFYGGMGIDNLFKNLYDFKQNGGLAICTTQFAESFDMETTDKAFMLGYDWDPQVNFQAEDRLDRLNNPHGLINIWYLMHECTIDEDILYTLTQKQENVQKTLSNRDVLKETLQRSYT